MGRTSRKEPTGDIGPGPPGGGPAEYGGTMWRSAPVLSESQGPHVHQPTNHLFSLAVVSQYTTIHPKHGYKYVRILLASFVVSPGVAERSFRAKNITIKGGVVPLALV